jgi:hypothetical protein
LLEEAAVKSRQAFLAMFVGNRMAPTVGNCKKANEERALRSDSDAGKVQSVSPNGYRNCAMLIQCFPQLLNAIVVEGTDLTKKKQAATRGLVREKTNELAKSVNVGQSTWTEVDQDQLQAATLETQAPLPALQAAAMSGASLFRCVLATMIDVPSTAARAEGKRAEASRSAPSKAMREGSKTATSLLKPTPGSTTPAGPAEPSAPSASSSTLSVSSPVVSAPAAGSSPIPFAGSRMCLTITQLQRPRQPSLCLPSESVWWETSTPKTLSSAMTTRTR